jgi:hypothetical protein
MFPFRPAALLAAGLFCFWGPILDFVAGHIAKADAEEQSFPERLQPVTRET